MRTKYVNIWMVEVREYGKGKPQQTTTMLFTDKKKAIQYANECRRDIHTYTHVFQEIWGWEE